jgi:hypothetical protein
MHAEKYQVLEALEQLLGLPPVGTLSVFDRLAALDLAVAGGGGGGAVSSVDARTGAVTLSDQYAALLHKASHQAGGADELLLAESQVSGLTAALLALSNAVAAKAALPSAVRRTADQPGSSAVGTWAASFNAAAPLAIYMSQSPNAQNNYQQWDLGAMLPGTYSLVLIGMTNPSSGIVSVSVDGGATTLGTTVDLYTAGTGQKFATITGITIGAAAVGVRLTVATKHASSTNYAMTVSAWNLIRTGA